MFITTYGVVGQIPDSHTSASKDIRKTRVREQRACIVCSSAKHIEPLDVDLRLLGYDHMFVFKAFSHRKKRKKNELHFARFPDFNINCLN